jgi:hypothetical protein
MVGGMVALLAFSSCIKEEFDADRLDSTLQINPEVAVPIGWAHYKMHEILKDTLNPEVLVLDNDSFLYLVYTQDLNSLRASDMVSIPDEQAQTLSFDNPFGTSFNLGFLEDTIFYDTIGFQLPLSGSSGAEIDSILVRWGIMDINLSSSYPALKWDAWIQIPGVPDWQVKLDDYNPAVTDTLEQITLPLKNDITASNQLCFAVEFRLWRDSTIVIDPGPIINADIGLSEIDYSLIWGYLGEFDIDIGPQAFPVDFPDRFSGGTFYFSDPVMKIHFDNSFGIPIGISMTQFAAVSGGLETPITGPGVPGLSDPKILAYPGWGQEGLIVADSLLWDSDNTNLPEALNTSPDEINVEVDGSTNPDGYTPNNFILDTSSLSISSELLLPLEGTADILITDTLDFIFGNFFGSPPEEILRLIFRMNYTTQFPVDISTQMYFYNAAGTLLDSLFHELDYPGRTVPGASETDDEGFAIPYSPEAVEVELSREQIDNISESYIMILEGRVKTTGSEGVRFYANYIFNTLISAIAELEMNSDDY